MSKPFNGLIGLHGKPRVGKDTVANYLIKKYSLLRYGPSVPVKDTTAAMFNIPRYWLDDNEMKEHYVEFWGMTVRQMAQLVGNESSRKVFGEDFWMRHVDLKLKEIHRVTHDRLPGHEWYKGMVLADIRYANEVDWVKQRGGTIVYIIRDNAPKTSDQGHAAEAGLPIGLADIVLYNNGTIEELYVQLENEFAFHFGWE